MEITVLGGAGEIGGNKILVEHDGTRILLDFGMSFKTNGKYFKNFVKARKSAGLADFFEMGLLPRMAGIYRNDYLEHTGLPAEEKNLDAVFISHAHGDHADFVHFLRADIPIYGSKETKALFEAFELMDRDGFNDYLSTVDTYTFRASKSSKKDDAGLVRVKSDDEDYTHERPFEVLVPGTPVKVEGIEVTPMAVDHSLPGSLAFILKADDKTVVYTGDLRFHGLNGALTNDFVDAAKASAPDCLICEGTHIDSDEGDSEADVEKEIESTIKKTKGLVLVEYAYKDLDRVQSILAAAKASGREFVIGTKLAQVLETLGDASPISLDDVKILLEKKSWGLIDSTTAPQKQIDQDYTGWERVYVSHPSKITAAQIAANPKRYAVSLTEWNIQQLVDMHPPEGTTWIKSTTEPFSDEMELDEARKQNWLAHFGIEQVQTHASGHASAGELFEMIETISPKMLIPVHTEHPELFESHFASSGITVVVPSPAGEKIDV